MSERIARRHPPSPPGPTERRRGVATGALHACGRRTERGTSEIGWTRALVAERLAEAADALARLPDERAGGFYDLWRKLVGPMDTGPTPAAPAPEAIDRLDEALTWLAWLEPEERRVVWLRAEGLPWKRITHRLGIGRTTAWQRWTTALLKISVRLSAADEQQRPNNKPLNRSARSVLQSR